MKIGLYLRKKFTFTHSVGVEGDDIWASALCKGLNKIPDVYARTYGKNMGYEGESDIAIYFHFTLGQKLMGKKNIIIFQNFRIKKDQMFEDTALKIIQEQEGIDKIATISKFYSEKFGYKLLYPAVDMEFFYPKPDKSTPKIDLSYIGNNIKDQDKLEDWLLIPKVIYNISGSGFNQPITHINSLRVFNNATANLNIGFEPRKEIITARIFQIAACKGLVISEYLPEYEKIFGDSMFWVHPGNERKQILDYLEKARNPEKKKEMTEKAYAIVKEKYSCEVQAKIFYDWVKENIAKETK